MKFSRFDRIALGMVLMLGVALVFAWREAQTWKPKVVKQWRSVSTQQRISIEPSKAELACIAHLRRSGRGVWAAQLRSPDSKMVLMLRDPQAPDFKYRAAIFSSETGRIISNLPSPMDSDAVGRGDMFSPDNRVLAFQEIEGRLNVYGAAIRFFDPRTGRQLWFLKNDYYSFTPDGKHVVALEEVGGVLNQIVVHEAWTGKVVRKLHRLPTKQNLKNSIQFSPDGTQILLSDHGGRQWQFRIF